MLFQIRQCGVEADRHDRIPSAVDQLISHPKNNRRKAESKSQPLDDMRLYFWPKMALNMKIRWKSLPFVVKRG